MITGKLKNGFEFTIDETNLDNMEYIDALAESEENSLMFSKVILLTLGKEQRDRLYNYVRLEDGRVPIETIVEVFREIMETSAETKNS